MKQFVTKLFFFAFIYVMISIVTSYFGSYHWGNPWYSTKVQFLESQKTVAINTCFFGSSKIYRHINPAVFDETLNSGEDKVITSFNFGAPATFNPQTYYLYEKFLDSKLAEGVRYCFMELGQVDLLSDKMLHQDRTNYWQNISDLIYVQKSVYGNKDLTLSKKMNSTRNYSISYMEKVLFLGTLRQSMLSENYYDAQYLGEAKNGFFPLEMELEITNDTVVKNSLFNRRMNFEADNAILNRRTDRLTKFYATSSSYFDVVNFQRIKKLILKSKERGIHLIFIVSPLSTNQKLINLSKQIPDMNLIDLCDPIKYKDMYVVENFFDKGHLNSKGADIYTELLAREFDRKILKNR